MLTKDLIKYRLKGGIIQPSFINPKDAAIYKLAGELDELYGTAVGLSQKELEKRVAEGMSYDHPLLAAFKKLLNDRVVVEEDDGSHEKRRWDYILAAQKLRRTHSFDVIAAFQERFAASLNQPFEKIKESLYGDLPENRKIVGFRGFGAVGLGHRYNTGLIQGLILRSQRLRLEIQNCDISQKRNFFRKLKFYRLLVEVRQLSDRDSFELELSGPLTMFDKIQSYGLRLANFFPHILNLPRWSLEADIFIADKYAKLHLNDQLGIKSHYQNQESYLPAEFSKFIMAFNEKSEANNMKWRAMCGGDFLNIGYQSYCFPDIRITGAYGQSFYIELFHRWFRGQIHGRIKSLEKNPIPNLIIGVCRSLKKDKGLATVIEKSQNIGIKILWFNEFLTPKMVLAELPNP